jgi:putative flippase GtrA
MNGVTASRVHHQFGRYLLVGLGNTLLSYLAYRLLLAVGTPYVASAMLAYLVGAANGYVFNARWTFAASDSMRARISYLAVQAAGAGVTTLLVFLLVHDAGIGKVWAYAVAIPPVTVATFVGNRVWTFRDRAS